MPSHERPLPFHFFLHHRRYTPPSSFLDTHPGGRSPLLEAFGREVGDLFDAVGHSVFARDWAERFLDDSPTNESDTGKTNFWRFPLQTLKTWVREQIQKLLKLKAGVQRWVIDFIQKGVRKLWYSKK